MKIDETMHVFACSKEKMAASTIGTCKSCGKQNVPLNAQGICTSCADEGKIAAGGPGSGRYPKGSKTYTEKKERQRIDQGVKKAHKDVAKRMKQGDDEGAQMFKEAHRQVSSHLRMKETRGDWASNKDYDRHQQDKALIKRIAKSGGKLSSGDHKHFERLFRDAQRNMPGM